VSNTLCRPTEQSADRQASIHGGVIARPCYSPRQQARGKVPSRCRPNRAGQSSGLLPMSYSTRCSPSLCSALFTLQLQPAPEACLSPALTSGGERDGTSATSNIVHVLHPARPEFPRRSTPDRTLRQHTASPQMRLVETSRTRAFLACPHGCIPVEQRKPARTSRCAGRARQVEHAAHSQRGPAVQWWRLFTHRLV
jgi:hypothetical protein